MGVNDARVWELVQRRDGRTVVIGLGWWTAALCSIALADIPPANHVAGIVVFGATVFGASSAVTAPFRLDRSLVEWTAVRLLAAFVGFGVVAAVGQRLLYPTTSPAVVYTQTPVEVPAILAGSVGSFLGLYLVGCSLRVCVYRGWSVLERMRSPPRVRVADRSER